MAVLLASEAAERRAQIQGAGERAKESDYDLMCLHAVPCLAAFCRNFVVYIKRVVAEEKQN